MEQNDRKTKEFSLENGLRATFDWITFRKEFERAKVKMQCKTDVELYRKIAKYLNPDLSYDDLKDSSTTDKIKKWVGKEDGPKSGPRDLSVIRKLAGFFDLEKDAFLSYCKETKEENKMNTVVQSDAFRSSTLIPPICGGEKLTCAMKSAGEKNAAHELYGALVDLIATYVQIDYKVWFEHSNCTMEELNDWLQRYPHPYSVRTAIRKSAIYLPAELRYRANDLLDEMYTWASGYACEWDELSIGTPHGDLFVTNKNEHFDAYLAKHKVKKDSLDDFDYDDQVFWFLKEQEQEWYDKLDDIFADYLCD